MKRKPDPSKRCKHCGKRLSRRRYGKTLEDYQTFQRRRFCSLSCSNSRLKGGVSRKAFCAQARKHRKSSCEACGGKHLLHVHHVNQNWRDNAVKNLQTLCAFCHQFWHATHRRVGVKPSRRMPKIVFRSRSGPKGASVCFAGLAIRLSHSLQQSSSSQAKKREPKHLHQLFSV